MWTYTVGFFLNHLGGRCRTESSNRCTSSPYNTSVVCCLRSPTVSQYRPNIPAQLAPGTAKRSKLNSLSKQGFFFQPIQHTHYQHVIPRFTKQRGQVNQNQTNRLYLRHHWYHQFSSFIFIFSLVYIFTRPNHLDS